MNLVRWRHVSLVFQGAMNSLDPVQRVDAQIAEAIRLHERIGSKELRKRIDELLTTVGITPALGHRYAHQLSGGQRQRVMVALALACRPVAGDRRRADDRARRGHAGAGPAAARAAARAARPRADPDLPRPRGAGRDLRPDRGHVRGADRRDRLGRRGLRSPAAPVHEAAARDAAGDRRAARPRGADPGRPARPREPCPRAAASDPVAPTRPRSAWPTRRCARSGPPTPRPATSPRGASGPKLAPVAGSAAR